MLTARTIRTCYGTVHKVQVFSETQLDEGTPNDEPNWLARVRVDGDMGWICGPSGTSADYLADWFYYDAVPAANRQEAISRGYMDATGTD